MMRDYALNAHLPVINENCPACFEEPKERARIKKLLSKEEGLVPGMFDNLRKAMTPLMDKGIGNVCRSFSQVVVERGRRNKEIRKKGAIGEAGGGERGVGMERYSIEEMEEEIRRRKDGGGKKGAFCNVDGTCEMFE